MGDFDDGVLHGRVALVTGGSGGIGGALIGRLAARGAHVAVGYGRTREPAEQVAERARSAGVRAMVFQADLTDPDSALRAAEQVESELGPIDVLVPNAGLADRRPLADIDLELWQRTLAVNLTAPFLLARRLVPAMAERGFGRVLFVSSVAALTGGIVGPHYAASKAGLHGLTYSLSAQFAGRGVTVNAIAPGLITGTRMLPGITTSPTTPPVGRLGQTDEVADLALAMLTNGYLTGKVITLDGGIRPG